MPKLNGQQLLTPPQAATALEELHRPPVDESTVRRWMSKGVAGVKLRRVRRGTYSFTKLEWIARFLCEVEAELEGTDREFTWVTEAEGGDA